MAQDFPNNPTLNELIILNGVTYKWNGYAWDVVQFSGITEIVQDTTPQLGGDLDLNGNDINGNGNVDITGNISATNILGDLQGDVVGNVTGDLLGDISSSGSSSFSGTIDFNGSTINNFPDTVVQNSLENLTIDDLGDVDTLSSPPTDGQILSWSSSNNNWEPANQLEASDLSTYLENVVEDTTPQLGGNLDLNSNDITGTGDINISGNITATGDVDATVGGFEIGYRNIPQITLSSNVTLSLSDSGKHYYSTLGTNTTITIPNNTSVNFEIGDTINIVNLGTGSITVAEDSGVTLYFAGTSTTGSRTISSYGAATLQKVETNVWFLVGVGVS